jgi:putative endonuclease
VRREFYRKLSLAARIEVPLPIWLYRHIPFGRRSEIGAAEYLRSLGFKIAASGYRTRNGEVDLVAWHGDVLVFVEVKARRSDARPEDNVGAHKQQRVIRAAHAYIGRYKLHECTYRFDILAVTSKLGERPEYRLLQNAFRDN